LWLNFVFGGGDMGYRSDVAFCISVDSVLVKPETGESYWDFDKEKFKEMVGFFKLTKFYELATDAEYDLIKNREPNLGWQKGDIIFHAVNWKWYSDYDDVKAWNEMWEQMQSIEGISGYFVRVGEENDDIEEMQFGDDPCYDHFHAFSALQFDGEDYLGKRDTDEEETKKEDTATPQPDCAGANHATETQ
jgi:hypothetical protein